MTSYGITLRWPSDDPNIYFSDGPSFYFVNGQIQAWDLYVSNWFLYYSILYIIRTQNQHDFAGVDSDYHSTCMDQFGINYNQPGTWTVGSSSQGPSQLTLAKISNMTYLYGTSGQVSPDVDGYQFKLVSGTVGADAFRAMVYQKDNQVVVAFRGTEKKDSYSAINTLLADVSFILGHTATDELVSQV